MYLSIREAAREAGVSKSTIARAIQRGRLSAGRDDDGNCRIDPAEVFRVYPPRAEASSAPPGQDASPAVAAVLQARIEGLDVQIAMLHDQLQEMRGDRDTWRDQAQSAMRQIADQRPVIVPGAPPEQPARRGWFGWRKAG